MDVTLDALERALQLTRTSPFDLTDRVPSAVCVPLVETPEGLEVWVIRRPNGMRHHARELAFPGGKAEPDDPSLLHTALRETEEELGVPRAIARLLGHLTPIPPFTSRFVIHPFVVAIEPTVAPRPAPAEVAELIRTPVTAFFDGRVPYEAVLFGDRLSPIFRFDAGPMYGASAHILRELLETWAALAGTSLPVPRRVDEVPYL